MSLTLDTTVGGTAANSYTDLAFASEYFEAVPHFTATWELWSTQQKIARLIEAARTLDRLGFQGAKVEVDQVLEFPRDVQEPIDDLTTIPRCVKMAQCEAVLALHNIRDATSGAPSRTLASVDIPGTVSITYSTAENKGERDALAGGSFETVRRLLDFFLLGRSSGQLIK